MRSIVYLFLCGALVLGTASLHAQDQDAEGCKDSAIITRMPGSTIHSCDNKEFDQKVMPISKDQEGNVKEKTVEGELHSWDYGTREGVSEIQVFRNFETALKKAGFTLVYEDSPGQITAQKGRPGFSWKTAGHTITRPSLRKKPWSRRSRLTLPACLTS